MQFLVHKPTWHSYLVQSYLDIIFEEEYLPFGKWNDSVHYSSQLCELAGNNWAHHCVMGDGGDELLSKLQLFDVYAAMTQALKDVESTGKEWHSPAKYYFQMSQFSLFCAEFHPASSTLDNYQVWDGEAS